MNVTLAIVCHDPFGRLYDQLARTLPVLAGIFDGLAVQASHATHERSLALFTSAGALLQQESADQVAAGAKIGAARRAAVEMALHFDCPFVMYCDADRALHWAERYPQELAEIAARLPEYDFTILGRTPRAFDSHPRAQRDTEAIVNRVFAAIDGRHAWDMLAAARGLSRRAAQAILDGCPDGEISTDVSWPLFLRQVGGYTWGYVEAEGLEFETADRYANEVAAAGGLARWLARLDADPRRWAHRLDMARVEVEAMAPYWHAD